MLDQLSDRRHDDFDGFSQTQQSGDYGGLHHRIRIGQCAAEGGRNRFVTEFTETDGRRCTNGRYRVLQGFLQLRNRLRITEIAQCGGRRAANRRLRIFQGLD